uniref:Pentatricopeptide repeat-containing protein n=1 Tax=Ananas comosus var. bracteatus TaxID=296719 RepID=A0A6V7PQ41_ANACO|nr:unnamed protein product [Ananas comosus var. bracteatus]
MLDGLCASGDPDGAAKLLAQMEQQDEGLPSSVCAPNVVTYTCLIKCLCEKNRLQEALALLDRMGKRGVLPNQVLIRTLLNGLCAGGRVDGAYDLIENVVGAGTISSNSCYSLLVTCLIKIHSLDEAEGLLRKMIEKGIKPSGLAFNSLVRELCRKGRILDGYSWFGVVEENGLADSDVYSMLLKRLCEEGYVNEGTMVGRKIVERNIHVEADCVEHAVEVLRKVGEEELASNILELKELQVVQF